MTIRALLIGPDSRLQAFHRDLTTLFPDPNRAPVCTMRAGTMAAYILHPHCTKPFHRLAHRHRLAHERLAICARHEHTNAASRILHSLPHDRPFTYADIRRLLHLSNTHIHSSIARLRQAGLVAHKRIGRNHQYRIVPQQPRPGEVPAHILLTLSPSLARTTRALYALYHDSTFTTSDAISHAPSADAARYYLNTMKSRGYLSHTPGRKYRRWYFTLPPMTSPL